ncbi:ectomycorrhiza-upregulated exo-beta-1,3-glucanase GH5 [Coprinopsis sp. MPI-PUGE-AT-0042]|nr:ectomycorrhiza-upregulated exo-beta-1,3-glucanase GH5 [Coprinopsis sp. MPI-PUGE-AT-0042]
MASLVNVPISRPSYDQDHDPSRQDLCTRRSTGDFSGHTSVTSKPEKHDHVSSDAATLQKGTLLYRGRRLRRILTLVAGAILILALSIGLPLGLSFSRKAPASLTSNGTGLAPGETDSANPLPHDFTVSGGDGSEIITEDGSTFVYSNKFGGFWVFDPNDPFNDSAQPNSWTPSLNQSWDFTKDKIYGVNLGGLFVLEPFISPALFQRYPGAIDEWTLSLLMAADTANGGLDQLEHHYNTFITEKDIAEIAGAGLNWVRLPIPYWAIETWDGEPFLSKTSWRYIVRLLGWCRKYGLRVNLDLHTLPGSQNGYNHSGRYGQVNFLAGVMGLANAQRALNYIRIIAEFISQPEWANVVPVFGIVNEPSYTTIGSLALRSFYVEAHRLIRSITGYGAGNGPYMTIHDGFYGPEPWLDFMRGADRTMMEMHPYFAFTGGLNTEPIATGTGITAGGLWPIRACRRWGGLFSDSRSSFGISVAGEWSSAWHDCGLFLNGIGLRATYGGNCEHWQDSTNWNSSTKAGILQLGMATMDALDSWFFWTWKIGNSTRGIVESPLWSYQLGLEEGWLPLDPRTASGTCERLGSPLAPTTAPYASWMTGGEGAGVPQDASRYPWPPSSIVSAGSPTALPVYTATGAIATLPPPTFTSTDGREIPVGHGWFASNDTGAAPAPKQGCVYPDSWRPETDTVSSVCLA